MFEHNIYKKCSSQRYDNIFVNYSAEEKTFHINPLDMLSIEQARCNRIEQQTTRGFKHAGFELERVKVGEF